MNSRNTAIKCLFAFYCLMMLWLLLLRRIGVDPGNVGVNLRPLDTVKRYIWVLHHSNSKAQIRYACANLLGNIVLLFPPGIFLPILFEKMQCFWRFFLFMALGILVVELCQLVTGLGACDVDDWMLNLTGAVTGWLIWKVWTKLDGRKTE